MDKKPHILFLTHYFPPEVNAPANRTYEHVRNWVEDCKVTVITNFPNHPDGKILNGYNNRLIQKETIDGINIVRLWTFITPNEGFILRTMNFMVFMFGSIVYSIFARIKFDIVISTTPQFFCGLAGKYIAKIKRKPFILEVRDLWPESIIAVGALKNKILIKILERVELNLYKAAKKIISVTKSFKVNMVARGIDPNKIEIIYNGVSFDIFKNGIEISNGELSRFLSTGFKIGYIGTIGMAHSINTLVEAAEKLKDKDVKFVIVGSGAQKSVVENLIKKKNLENIKLFPLQPKNEIPSIIKRLDIFCVHLKKDPLFKTVIPSKMFEGMVMKKPILIGVDGESRDMVENAGSGIFFEPENADDLANKILYLKENSGLVKEFGENGFNYVNSFFNRQNIAKEYLKSIKKTVG